MVVGGVVVFVFWFREIKRLPRQIQKNSVYIYIYIYIYIYTTKTKNKKKRSNILGGATLFVFGLGLRVVPQTRPEGSNSISRAKHEHAGGSDVLQGMVCHGGGDNVYLYIFLFIYLLIYVSV